MIYSFGGVKISNFNIRKINSNELHLLENFLYEAIFQRDETRLIPRDVINQPEVRVFIEDFGKPDDYCLVADIKGKVVGAVWARILSGEVKGFGNIDDQTPEFAISLYKEYRNIGIGTALMQDMLKLLKEQGYKRTSLAVQKDNYAVRMYQKVGFEIIKELEEEYLMVCNLAT
ncbi:GNAT family N-acetyltransferase [Mobilitalea sibirica]|uniref:GNAT family N-acetyltransferase n=1 Tax=Mobilitalea sibirica TaxID=1462919 RepID=A0A8J7HA93_9FIRM|nr:GNAT family N-acetyltransferase [Mobilitalea sibirica]MBH1939716.1 GNAT family N-acetyltransferase [Mobilitalea sibirica]